MLEVCQDLTAATASGSGPLLLIGHFADSPYEKLAARPAEARRAYYGLPIPDLGLYLGFAQHALFDVPLLATGGEDLYATLAPSPGLTEGQLREILYDHLVERRAPEPDYEELSREALEELADYG